MRVVANTSFEYQGKIYRKGDWVVGVTPALAHAWKLMQRADIRAEDVGDGLMSPNEARAALGLKPIESGQVEQPRQKRRYRRRDMRVED